MNEEERILRKAVQDQRSWIADFKSAGISRDQRNARQQLRNAEDELDKCIEALAEYLRSQDA